MVGEYAYGDRECATAQQKHGSRQGVSSPPNILLVSIELLEFIRHWVPILVTV